MILPIYVYGQPVLRKVAEDIAPDYPNLKELIENMFETMDNAEGVGLGMMFIMAPSLANERIIGYFDVIFV